MKCRNRKSAKIGTIGCLDFSTFQFQTFRPYGTCQFCQKTEPVRNGLLSLNCLKSKQFRSDFGRILFGLGLMSKIETFCPIWPYGCSVFRQKFFIPNRNFFYWISEAVQIPHRLELGQKVDHPRTKRFRMPNIHCT